MTPAQLAKLLNNKFLEEGNFEVAGSSQSGSAYAAISGNDDVFGEYDASFSNLSVQAVGYSQGVNADVAEAKKGVFIYVTRGTKRAIKSLPETLDGVPLIIESIGKITVKPQSASSNRGNIYRKNNRVACGSSCAPSQKNYSGTFGALARKTSDPSVLHAISNNHVFADCNHLAPRVPIMSPSSKDSGIAYPPLMFAQHSEMIELRSGNPLTVTPCYEDLAIALVQDESKVSSWQGDQFGYDTPSNTMQPFAGLKVKKFGRTTGLTHGIIESVTIRTPVRYQADDFKAIVWFQNVWVVRALGPDPFAIGGDSGSLVVTEDGSASVGMVFASNNRGDYVNIIPIDRISRAFGGLELVGGHGI